MGFYLRYPSASSGAENPSVGTNGATAPTSSTEIGGIGVDGNLHGVSVDNTGKLNVNISSSVLPTGGATAANQALEITQLNAINTNTAGLLTDTQLRATAVPVSGPLTDTQLRATAVPVSGPLTDTQLRASAVPVSLTSTTITGTVAATQSGSWTTGRTWTLLNSTDSVNAVQSGTWNITNISGTISLPTGAATESTLSTLNGKVTAVNTGAVTISSALPAGSNVIGHVIVDSTKAPVNSNGSIVNTSLTATTASSASAPANAVGFVLEAPSDNTHNIRWCIGSTASTTVGMLAEPGRDSGYIPCAANISICATASGTNAYSIQWILSA